MTSKIKTLVFVCLTGALAFGSTASFALINGCPDPAMFPGNGCNLPGITAGSFPYFDQAVDVKYKETNNGFKIKAKFLSGSKRSSLVGASDVYSIDNTKYKLSAEMKNDTLSGMVRIKGKIQDLGINKQKTLMEADLMDAFDSAGNLVGFNTENIVCHQAIIDAVGCTSSESVYLSLIEDIFASGASKVRTAGVAVTTVPLPAAVWLFASGLLGLAGMARRRGKV
jgi:hypothetical protein